MLNDSRRLWRVCCLASALLCSQAGAAAGWAAMATALLAEPNAKAAALRVVAAKETLDIVQCHTLWCQVRVGGQLGWVNRAAVNVKGDCPALLALGLKDIRRNEAAYSAERDPDHNGRACDQRDLLNMLGRR
ncbi:hypothetical protein K7W42_06020 [Deinococcus sp. HMF7604]|uniref:SH3 domain-containing protein n=1 Tax=Deinococcus betulae TaxID=2873312 RepID=UPI001CCF6F82|nr:SH3 domain-containing protein [Deinococcus betulae]MBZ9750415.1 hypothetical protein [Deinococcus betulae]